MTHTESLLSLPAAPAQAPRTAAAAGNTTGFTHDDFEIIELQAPYDPRITKFVGLPRGARREPLIAIRRKIR